MGKRLLVNSLKEKIANVIAESLEHDFLDKKYSLGLDSHNCLGIMKSDVINTNLNRVFCSDRYNVHTFKRFAWEGRFIIDCKTKSLVSITSISNLNRIPKVKGRKFPHYMQTCLNYFNESIAVNKQISFDGLDIKFDTQLYNDDMSEMLSGTNIDLDDYTYYIVAYDYNLNRVDEINWYLLGPDFNVVEKSSIMNLIKPDFINLTLAENSDDSNTELQKQKELPKKGIKLVLKENILKKEG